MITCLCYDDTFAGLLTAVFEIYARKCDQVLIRRVHEAPSLFCEEEINVFTDLEKAARVAKRIETLSGKEGLSLLRKSWLSALPGIDTACIEAIRYLLRRNEDVFSDYGDPHVLKLRDTEKMMRRESHRMKAFVRFSRGDDGLYIATVEPDFNVLPLIISHFEERYADQRWLIYDTKRNYGIFYDLQSVTEVQFSESEGAEELPLMHTDETQFRELWQDYFHSTNIKSRRNMKLHLRHVPRRYWKFLVEKKV